MCNRTHYVRFTSTLALLYIAVFSHAVAAQTFERLPQTFRIAQRERLPRTDEGPALNSSPPESRETIRFAGGSIELQVPQGWWAEEIPVGREVRLVIAPRRPANVRKMPSDGMWMAYHAVPQAESQTEETLSREFTERLRSGGESGAQVSPPTRFQFGRWPAVVAEFTASESALGSTSITCRQVLVRTDWGVFEFHASAPDAIVESRSSIWTATWESLRLNPPATASGPARNGARESNSIIGDWKSYRSRMRFSDDGRVVIVPDSAGNNQSSSPLTGTFDARDDLVFVHWDDGSRLNFRWRLEGNDLLLTDHEGQISHLKRVFD